MRRQLDGMQVLMEGSGSFDNDFYTELVGCFERFDPGLLVRI